MRGAVLLTIGAAIGTCPSARTAEAKPILTLTETDENGDQFPLTASKNTVDINSRIEIVIDEAELRAAIARSAAVSGDLDALADAIGALTAATERGATHLRPFGDAVQKWIDAKSDADRTTATTELAQAVAPLATAVQSVGALQTSRPGFRRRLNAALAKAVTAPNARIVDQYAAVLDVYAAEAELIGQELEVALDREKVQVQLGAWLSSPEGGQKPIHLAGFDTFQSGTAYRVPRFVLPTTAQMAADMAKAESAAKRLSDRNGGLVGIAREVADEALGNIRLQAETCAAEVQRTLKDKIAVGSWATLRSQLQGAHDRVEGYVTTLELIATRTVEAQPGAPPSQALGQAIASITTLYEETRLVLQAVKDLHRALAAITSSAPSGLASVKTKLNDCIKRFDQVMAVALDIRGVVSGATGGLALARETLSFSAAIKRFSVSALPRHAELALVRTGERSERDSILIRIQVVQETRETPLETHAITMFRVLAHTEMGAGVIFVRPFYPEKTSLRPEFQFSPSYSVVLTRGSRDYPSYNRFFRLGIGLNVASLDFNYDGEPEVGLAVVLSGLAQFVQAGMGFNLMDGNAYWYFGAKLPLVSFALSGSD